MGWNVGMAELGVRELASILTTTGPVVNHSAMATAMNIAAPIPASPFMLILSRIKVLQLLRITLCCRRAG